MRQRWLITGSLVIVLALVAACDLGGDDDDAGLDVEEGEQTLVEDATEAGEEIETQVFEGTATSASRIATETDEEGTEDDTTTETEEATTGTGEEDGTPTEEDEAATETDGGTAIETGTTGAGDEATETEESRAEATGTEDEGIPEEDGAAGVGEPIEVDDLVLTVDEIVMLDATAIGEFGEILGLEEGNQFLGVSMTVENTGSDPAGVAELLGRIDLEDDDGDEYGVDLGATALALLSGEFENVSRIEAGDEVPLMLGFQIPGELQVDDLTLLIEPEDDSEEPIEVPLGNSS